jgi:hypothetical protein
MEEISLMVIMTLPGIESFSKGVVHTSGSLGKEEVLWQEACTVSLSLIKICIHLSLLPCLT